MGGLLRCYRHYGIDVPIRVDHVPTMAGEIALREYSVNGDARNFNNWVLTGRNWDVNYSENTVSDKRLTDSDAQ